MKRQFIPGGVLALVGGFLLAGGLVSLPAESQGGPAFAWVISELLIFGFSGSLAILVGAVSLHNGKTRLPTLLLALYATVGIIYGSIRLSLLRGFSVIGFTLFAVILMGAILYATHILTRSWSADSTG